MKVGKEKKRTDLSGPDVVLEDFGGDGGGDGPG